MTTASRASTGRAAGARAAGNSSPGGSGGRVRQAAADRGRAQLDAYNSARAARTDAFDARVGQRSAAAASVGPGVILTMLAWTWIGLPFLRGGPTAVKNMLKAKFTNKAPDGSYLP